MPIRRRRFDDIRAKHFSHFSHFGLLDLSRKHYGGGKRAVLLLDIVRTSLVHIFTLGIQLLPCISLLGRLLLQRSPLASPLKQLSAAHEQTPLPSVRTPLVPTGTPLFINDTHRHSFNCAECLLPRPTTPLHPRLSNGVTISFFCLLNRISKNCKTLSY